MKTTTTFLIALAVASASLALAQTPRLPAPSNNNKAYNTRIMAKPQVMGRITLAGAPAAAASDACSKFTVLGMEPTPAGTADGGIALPGGKETGAKGRAHGNIRQGACSYMISGLPTGKPVYVAVKYTGPMGGGGNATTHFTLAPKQTASHDILVSFVTPR